MVILSEIWVSGGFWDMANHSCLNEMTRWSAIRYLGNSPVVKLTPLVPVIGYFILFNKDTLDFVEMSPDISSTDYLTTLEKMYFLYFGLTLIGFASLMYNLFCPKTVKTYRVDVEFVQSVGRIITIGTIRTFVKETIETTEKSPATINMSEFLMHMRPNMKNLGGHTESANLIDDVVIWHDGHKEHIIQISDMMLYFYRFRDFSLFYTRILVSIMFLIGTVFLAIPTLSTFVAILTQFMREFAS